MLNLRHGGHHIPELWREGGRKEWCECNQVFIGGIKELRLLLRHILTFLGKVRLYAKRENVAESIRDNEVECLKVSNFEIAAVADRSEGSLGNMEESSGGVVGSWGFQTSLQH